MPLTTLYKQPTENKSFLMDMAANMSAGETIATVTSVVATPADPALVVGTGVPNGQQVAFRISGGTNNTRYKVTCIVTTSNGNTLEGDGYLVVVNS